MTATRYAQAARFSFSPPPPPDPLADPCPAAKAMIGVCQPLLDKVRLAPDEVSINVALLQLQQQYHLRYEGASRAHKDHIGTRNNHTCLHQVWCHYYAQFRELLLAVNPPPLRPAPPPAAPQPTLLETILGEVISGEQ